MLKKFAIAGAMVSAAVVGAPSHAATTIISITLNEAPPNFFSGSASQFLVGDFDYTFQFTSPLDGASTSSVNFTVTAPSQGITFETVALNGISLVLSNSGTAFQYSIDTMLVGDFLNSLQIVGNTQGNNATANVTIAAVPEPTTWAMFILGFGAIGAGLRRRSGQVRVSKAQLHFS